MAGVHDVKNGKTRQEQVYKTLKRAAKLLESAADVEHEIESERLRLFNPVMDDSSDQLRDPLEDRVRTVVEQLDEYGYL